MRSKLLVSMLALGLAAGTGAALAQGTGSTKTGCGRPIADGRHADAIPDSADDQSTRLHKATQSRQSGKQMGQAGQENAPSGKRIVRAR